MRKFLDRLYLAAAALAALCVLAICVPSMSVAVPASIWLTIAGLLVGCRQSAPTACCSSLTRCELAILPTPDRVFVALKEAQEMNRAQK